ncbi:hypothetical protein SSBR45G_17560 [Bradyrhizobium sp. SSBR45G]|uniref:hypothetical protein n=1 Tax=unclassified Bradyrhizobium TaxID=2631580 RepID=UPI0023429938|nr:MULTISPECIES: hypothetical protein [unclassified Bradyrhizobium]GLH76848.1 hypothetical protein SSBR45G_17560 [Bradyrhizobium sp. SSBR45G]GLH83606.1 hypothetical protein SSBR45R_10660 [Bradyrhizobium sp. SSBR45R]
MLRRLLQPLWVLLAIIFLIEAWLWDRLEPIVARIVAALPLRSLKHWLAARIESLSPALTLVVFIVPVVMLFPLKLVGMWLLMHHKWKLALVTIMFGKIVGVGITAFIFDVTRHKLLQMSWFAWLYETVLTLRRKAAALVDPIKQRAREILRDMLGGTSRGWSARMVRQIMRFRRSVQQAR